MSKETVYLVFIKDKNCQFYFLQEIYSVPDDVNTWSNEWGGDIFFSHGSTHSRGVCILINPSCSYTVESLNREQNGRIISINLSSGSANISLCNIYAPNDLQQQLAFLRNLNNFLITNVDIGNLIVGGDWNVTLEAVDKRGGSQWKPTSYRNQLISMMEEFSLVDIYRNLNPSKLCFTYESKALKLSSRIDFFLVSQPLANRVSHVDTLVSIAPDHKAIRVQLQLENDNRGPGLWKFNNSLLEDEIYVKLITDSYAVIQNKYSEIEDKRLKWELIKMEIRGITIPLSENKAKQLHQKERDIPNRLQVLDRVISNSPNTDCIKNEINEYNNLKEEIDLIYQKKGKGSIIRSKCKWIERCEKPTAFFFNLEKRNYNRKSIKKLEGAGGTTLTNEDEILNEIETFYKQLYNCGLAENDLFDLFVQSLKTPKLQDQQRNELEGEITLAECKVVLRTFSSGKSPGEDCFTWEFYNCFFELLGQDLVNCFNEAYMKGEMSISQRRGVISLLPKEDANLLKLANWRPITLLNVDYKIASKVIATRFEKVLDLLISPDQTGFLKGRYIGQNIRLVNDVVEQTKIQNIPGIRVQLDFCKAFDTIEWSFIKRSLALFNFGDSIQQWVSTFYSNSESAVLNNGFCTKFFKLSRGVRQGCPLCPYLFIVGAEILACKIRQDKTIKGITVFQKELKLSQFADDTTLLCNDCNSVNRAITVLNSFGNLSGLRLNPSKTEALWLGSSRNRKDEPFNFKWPKEPLRVLRTYI